MRPPSRLRARAQRVINVVYFGPDVYSFGGTQSVIRTLRDHNVGADSTRAISTWDGPGHAKNFRLVGRALRELRRLDKATVVHVHMANGGAWLRDGLVIRAARARGLPVVVSLHGFDIDEFALARPRFVRFWLRRVQFITCLSPATADAVRSAVGTDRVAVIANPVPIDHDSPPVSETDPVVLFAGTIGLRKGVDVLSEAWQKVLDHGIEGATCRVVGLLDDFTPPPLPGLVVEPAVNPDDIQALIRDVRVVTLPSRAEMMPMILTEALAGGRPFVATAVGGTPDLAPCADMLVPVGDADALARALIVYLEDPQRAQHDGELGRDHIERTRSPAIIGAQLRAIYEGALRV